MRPPARRLAAVVLAAALAAVVAAVAATTLLAGGDDAAGFRAPDDVEELADRIRKAVPAALAEGHVPGAAVAVVHGGRVAWSSGFGVLEAGGRAPVTAATRFQAASLSKPVTAWGAVTLARRGTLPLDAPLPDLLGTRWPLPPSEHDAGQITPRRLLSHTAGLSVEGYLGVAPGTRLPTTRASMQGRGPKGAATAVRLVARPGTRWRYSGGGYTLLQYAIEELTGRGFADWAQDAVLRPLGMRASVYGGPTATGHDADGRPLPAYRYAELAAAGLTTTATDLGRFVAALVGPLAAPPHPIAAALMEVQPRTGAAYGLGLQASRLGDGTRVRSHEGVNRGWHARLVAYPERGWGFVVLTNGDGGGAVADAVQRQFEG